MSVLLISIHGVKRLFSIDGEFNQNEFWSDLYNKDSNNNRATCQDSACNGQIFWNSDGSLFSWPIPIPNFGVNADHYCMSYRGTKWEGNFCGENYYYICEWHCPPTTTTTTTTTTSTSTTTIPS